MSRLLVEVGHDTLGSTAVHDRITQFRLLRLIRRDGVLVQLGLGQLVRVDTVALEPRLVLCLGLDLLGGRLGLALAVAVVHRPEEVHRHGLEHEHQEEGRNGKKGQGAEGLEDNLSHGIVSVVHSLFIPRPALKVNHSFVTECNTATIVLGGPSGFTHHLGGLVDW